MIKIRWENEARGRYYLVYLHRDLFGDWQLTRVWGRKGSSLGQTRHDMVDSEQTGREMIKKIAIRRKQRGYRIREGNTEALPLSDDNE